MLIAEIGNNHFGDKVKFLELAKAAKDSGATHVKSQAGVRVGSMDPYFYKVCDLGLWHYIELIYTCRDKHGIDLFYSIFDEQYSDLVTHQNFIKLAASQADFLTWKADSPKVICSLKAAYELPYDYQRTRFMYASEYLAEDPQLTWVHTYRKKLGRPVGYSDHTLGVEACKKAIEQYGARVIEKHFTLEKDLKFQGKLFRDTVHGATPKEFEEIAKCLIGNC